MREVVEGGTSTTGRKIGGGRPRHREEGSRFLTPEVRYWGAQVEGGKMKISEHHTDQEKLFAGSSELTTEECVASIGVISHG